MHWCKDNIADEFSAVAESVYKSMSPLKSERVSFEAIMSLIKEWLDTGSVDVVQMNGKSDVDSSQYESGCNFVIGGNTLGRGVTFPCLETIYYTRSSKNLKRIQCGNTVECLDMTETLD